MILVRGAAPATSGVLRSIEESFNSWPTTEPKDPPVMIMCSVIVIWVFWSVEPIYLKLKCNSCISQTGRRKGRTPSGTGMYCSVRE